MYKFILMLAIAMCSFLDIMAQSTYVQFIYDTRGNRVGRQIVIGPHRKADVLSNKILDTNAIVDRVGKAKVLIYPNPIIGEITVKVQDEENTEPIHGTLQVFNVLGNKVGETTIKEGIGNFDFQYQATGTYILRINYNNNNLDWKILKE
jgi:hypothetical protein